MKDELKQSANRHTERLLGRISDVLEIPPIIAEAIRREIEYATMDGYRITARHLIRNGEKQRNEVPVL